MDTDLHLPILAIEKKVSTETHPAGAETVVGGNCSTNANDFHSLKTGKQSQADDISGFHANTHIPVVVGSQMQYEVTGDSLYQEIGTYFMDIVNSSHSYPTGGTSVSEFWSDPKRLAGTFPN